MTYRGHSVLRTLIRCRFSPIETTGGQYLYSGSSDGKIHVRKVLYGKAKYVDIRVPDLVLGRKDRASS